MNTYNFRFKKSFGQNFLKENAIVEKIANSAEIKENSLVIEIGSGSGMLTKPLATHANQVLSYEIDSRLEEILDRELIGYSNVDIIYDDFLKRNLTEDLKPYQYDFLYVVANLPYYITTPIITKVIEEKIDVERIVVMVQKEVGDRFTAKPGTKEYSSLTVFLNYYFDIQKLFVVNRNCFVPKPNVDSIVISLTKKKELIEVQKIEFFFELVRDSFRFKRKTLRNNLKKYDLLAIEDVLKQYGFDLSVRAEQLSIEVFRDISNILS